MSDGRWTPRARPSLTRAPAWTGSKGKATKNSASSAPASAPATPFSPPPFPPRPRAPPLRANFFNFFSLSFADVIWTGLSTRHVRQGMEGHVELEPLRDAWAVIAPASFIDHYARFPKKSLFIYATYDTTFWPRFSQAMLQEIRRRNLEHEVAVLPCGHYTLGRTPFQFLDGYHIGSFLKRSL